MTSKNLPKQLAGAEEARVPGDQLLLFPSFRCCGISDDIAFETTEDARIASAVAALASAEAFTAASVTAAEDTRACNNCSALLSLL